MTIKKLLLLLLIVPLVLSIQSCGKGAGEGYTPPGSGPGDPVYIKLKPARYAAQTNGCIDFYAEVHDAQGELLANIPVTFTNLSEPLGVILDRCGGIEILTPVTTDSWGRAKITVMSTTPGFVTVLAQTNLGAQPRDRKTVLYSFCDTYECLVLAPSLHLDVNQEPPILPYNKPEDFIIFNPPPDPDDRANLLATVRDEYTNPIPYLAHVVWGTDHEEAVYIRTESYTNEDGQAAALVEFTPTNLRGAVTHVNVWAYSDNVSSFVYPFDIVTFFLEPIFITSVTVTADPSILSPDASSTITATVLINTGTPPVAPDGVAVTFTSCLCEDPPACTICTDPCGIVDPFSETEGGNGQATSLFTAPPIPGTCMVTARANGVEGSTNILVTTDLTVTPDSIDVNGTVGGTATFTVTGGVAPYTVVSNSSDPTFDPAPATVVNDGDTFAVTVPAGTESQTIEYTIRDAVGTEVTAQVVISTDALAVFPSSVTIDAGIGGVATFTIFDGVPGYDVFSSDPALPPVPAAVAASGDTFVVTVPAGTPATSVTYTIRDASGATTTATVTITLTPLAVNPVTQTISCSLPAPGFQYIVTGGVPPYASTSLNPAILGTTDNATGFLALPTAGACAAIPAGTSTSVSITVQDSAAGLVNATCVVTNP